MKAQQMQATYKSRAAHITSGWSVSSGLTQLVLVRRSLNVTVAAYSQGALLLADTLSEGRSRVILVTRDLTIPPVGGNTPGLRELVCEVSPAVPGMPQASAQQIVQSCSTLLIVVR